MGPHEGAVETDAPPQPETAGKQTTEAPSIIGGFSGQTSGRPPKLSQREKDMLELDHIYTYHAPHGNQVSEYQHLRTMAKLLAQSIITHCPPSRERALALTNVQTASMFANAAIAIHTPAPVGEPSVSADPSEPARRLDQIAAACHNANRNYCRSLGDYTQYPWDEAEEWQRISARNGVRQILDNPLTTPEQSHENWMKEKLADGWQFGTVKDPVAKLHPCILPYDLLPAEQRVKDAIFGAVARAVAGI